MLLESLPVCVSGTHILLSYVAALLIACRVHYTGSFMKIQLAKKYREWFPFRKQQSIFL